MASQNYAFEKVMIIDDNKTDRYIASYIINKSQFADQVSEFDMATKALAFLEEHQQKPEYLPEVIFLDINMPEMDGFQFLEALSTLPDETTQKLSVIMLSSSLNPSDHEKAANNGLVKKFLNKPLNKTNLETIIGLR